MVDDNVSSRRSVLKWSGRSLAALGAVSAVTGSASGQKEEEEEEQRRRREDKPDRGEVSVERPSGDPEFHDSVSEYQNRVNRMGTGPDNRVKIQQAGPDPTLENLDYVGHMQDDVTLEGSFIHYADVEFTLTGFEAVDDDGNPLTDSDGNYYYVLELYQFCTDVTQELREMSVSANIENYVTLESRSPRTSTSVNGAWVTLREGATVGGTGFSAEAETWVNNGTFGPKTWVPGKGGEYGIIYEGSWTPEDGSQFDNIGFASVKSPLPCWSMRDLLYTENPWDWNARAGWNV